MFESCQEPIRDTAGQRACCESSGVVVAIHFAYTRYIYHFEYDLANPRVERKDIFGDAENGLTTG